MGRPIEKKATNNLRAWREFRKLSQDRLGEMVGTKGNVIGNLEAGERQLSQKWLIKLADALGTTAGFLLDHDPNDIDTAFIEEMMQVPKEKRDQVRKIVETFRTGTRG